MSPSKLNSLLKVFELKKVSTDPWNTSFISFKKVNLLTSISVGLAFPSFIQRVFAVCWTNLRIVWSKKLY